jgi:hypothetical protein
MYKRLFYMGLHFELKLFGSCRLGSPIDKL